jgi:hypothetical protein
MLQMAIEYMYHYISFPGPLTCIQIGILGMQKYHLATLVSIEKKMK